MTPYVDEFQPKHFGKIMGLDPDVVFNDDEEGLSVKDKKKHRKKQKNENLMNNEIVENESEHLDRDEKNSAQNNGNLAIQRLEKNSAVLAKALGKLKSIKERHKCGQIILEGKRLINDAISAGHQPMMLFFSRISDLQNLNLSKDVRLYRTTYKSLKIWSDVCTTQGVIGVFKVPEVTTEKAGENSIPLTIICDNVREPGNLGSILRVVAGVGCEKVILTSGCVDLWNPKVLRSAAGSHFRLPVLKHLTWNEIAKEVDENDQILLAENKDSRSYESAESKQPSKYQTDLPAVCYTSLNLDGRNVVLIIGGETHGISEEAYDFLRERQGARVYIPMANNVESLNTGVALGILSYEVRRQLSVFSLEEEKDKPMTQEQQN
ncbi:hypothetical protein RUM44_008446 [Polyplax serrata]|uniref:Uncharacterized protein n=1 Tax=Polyplax serrata TaxID=468196 RepID=A0ABR1B8I9_POLSC